MKLFKWQSLLSLFFIWAMGLTLISLLSADCFRMVQILLGVLTGTILGMFFVYTPIVLLIYLTYKMIKVICSHE